jgi:hypothetical protein
MSDIMSWTTILKKEPPLKKKIWRASKTGNFDELIENHSKAQLRRRANELVEEEAVTEEKMKPLFDALGASHRDKTGKQNKEYQKPNKKEIEMFETFIKGGSNKLPEYLNTGTAGNKRVKVSRMIDWDSENGDKILKFVRDKPELYGYNTEGLTLELPATFDRDKLGDLQYQLGNSLIVTLPPHLSIKQGKTLAGGTPSEPIERNFFARVYKAPKYKTEIVKDSITTNPEEYSDQFAKEYLTMIITNLRGNIREDFMPNIFASEIIKPKQRKAVHQEFFGADTAGGTSRIYPALEFILSNEKLDLDVPFAKNQTKESLQEKELARKFKDKEIDDAQLIGLFNRYVKVKGGGYIGYSKFKEALNDADLMGEYQKLLDDTQVRRYTLDTSVRDALVAVMDSEGTPEQVALLKTELRPIFRGRGFKKQIRTMTGKGGYYGDPEKIKEALLDMKEKGEGKVSITDKKHIPLLQFLFTEIDSDPMGNFLSSSKTNTSNSPYAYRDRPQVLEFSDVIVMLISLEEYLLRQNNLRVLLDVILKPIDDKEDAVRDFTEMVREKYGPIRQAFLLAIKKKMSQVVGEPILHSKSMVQPYDWIQSGGRTL